MPYSLIKLLELEINKPPIKLPILIHNEEEFNNVKLRLIEQGTYPRWSIDELRKLTYPFYIQESNGSSSYLITSKTGHNALSFLIRQIKNLPKDKKLELRQILKTQFNIEEVLNKLNELGINKPFLRFPIKINSKEEYDNILQQIESENENIESEINKFRIYNPKKALKGFPFYIVQYPPKPNILDIKHNPNMSWPQLLIKLKKSLSKEQQVELRQFIKDKYKIQENKAEINEEETFYHGTSHYFKCFRTAGVGGGAGMQVFGWGLYFGKDVSLANSYAGIGTHSGKKMLLFQGKTPAELAFEYDCIIFERLPSSLTTIEEFTEYAQDMIELLEEDGDNPELVNEYKRFIQIIKELNIEQEPMKYVYEVLLHKGKKPSEYEYLNWDANTPQNQIDKINNQAKKEHLNLQVSGGSGSNVYSDVQSYFKNKGSNNAPKDASLFLLRSGIDGNTHSNGTVRIIFDEKAITIVNVCKKK